jgi:hypothetical protein
MAAPITTTATNLVAQMLEVAGAVQSAELALPEETRPDNISFTPDTEAGTIAISISLPVTFSSAAGKISYTAVDYLV